MPDISMCMNKECPSKNQCFRFRAVPHPYRQAYSEFKHEDDKCVDFVDIANRSGYAIRSADHET